ncbi:hypothetical protein BASA61_008820 [Batrachochytrium salamandrivorans]|nr:hypothetical protein BASA61_008820 [Batrachochytrium salamandrivorans]
MPSVSSRRAALAFYVMVWSMYMLQPSHSQPCPPATSIGTFIVHSPNQSSILVVGQQVAIAYSFTPQVKHFPTLLSIKLQQIPASGASVYPIILAENVSVAAETRSVQVVMRPLNDGEYRFKLIGDGKESLNLPGANSSTTPSTTPNAPCLSDGDAIAGISGAFHVVNPLILTAFKDRFGPQWSGAGLDTALYDRSWTGTLMKIGMLGVGHLMLWLVA